MGTEYTQTALQIIRSYDGPPVRIMEVCGTHTHEIFRLGIRQILPSQVDVISGPGCPVCVTPVGYIDEAVWLALEKGVTICTFGDLVRVPGSTMSLAGARSRGAHVEIVYSPLDAYDYARQHRDEEVVFLSVGFETTTPPSCLAVRNARRDGVTNFSLLTAVSFEQAMYGRTGIAYTVDIFYKKQQSGWLTQTPPEYVDAKTLINSMEP